MKKLLFTLVLCACQFLTGCTLTAESSPKAKYLDEDMAELRYPYQQLSEIEKATYTALYYGINNMDEKIKLPYTLDSQEYEKVFNLLYRQESSFFYLDTQYFLSDKMSEAKMIYHISKEEKQDYQREINEKVLPILEAVSQKKTEYEKILYIHDYLAKNCQYSQNDEPNMNTIYGCLVNNLSQCEGYAKTLLYLARESGLSAMTVVGQTNDGVNHEWNIVRIDGKYYNIDLTWNDPLSEEDTGRQWYLYFNVRDDEINNITHFPSGNNYTPPECNSTDANYYYMNGLVADSYEEAYSIIKREATTAINSKKDYVDVKFTNKEVFEQVKKALFDNGEIFTILNDVNTNDYYKIDADQYVLQEKDGIWCVSIGLVYK